MLTKGKIFGIQISNRTLLKAGRGPLANHEARGKKTVQEGFWSISWRENKVRGVAQQLPNPLPQPQGL